MKLIVEMEMPKKNRFCGLQCADLYCVKTSKKCNVFNTGERPSWCPIKGELPDEHGDLVDADTVLWEVLDSEWIVPPMPVTIGEKTFLRGYYWENYYGEGVHLEDRLNEFFDEHNYCSEPKAEPPFPYDEYLFPLPEDCDGCDGAFDIVYENSDGTGVVDPRYR